MKPYIYISCCSFGKDSIATILLALENNEPIDKVLYVEVMFDNDNNISGEYPIHRDWIYSTAIPRLQKLGLEVIVLRAAKDYVSIFKTVRKRGKYEGKMYGFPIGGKCIINSDCKMKPIRTFYKSLRKNYNIIEYVGIAADEFKRLRRLSPNKVSLLAKYGICERDAYTICKKYGLLSPLYAVTNRGGCWFCMNNSIKELSFIRESYPTLWSELNGLSKLEGLCSYGFKYGKTLGQVEKLIDNYRSQLNLFY